MKTLSLFLLIFISARVMAQQKVIRKDLLETALPVKAVSNVKAKEITMAPFQTGSLHKHPCPVFGYVAEGKLLFQIQGRPSKTLQKGDAFYEPAETAIAHFDNASDQPLKFVAFYLTNGEQQLIEMLPEKK